MKRLFLILISNFMFSSVGSQAQLIFQPVYEIPIGSMENEIAIFRDQTGVDFEVSSTGKLFLLDCIHNKIKVFDQYNKYCFSISPTTEKIARIHLFSNLLVVLNSNNEVLIYNLNGELLFSKRFNIVDAQLSHTIFYDDMIFLPKTGRDSFNEEMIAYKILIDESKVVNQKKISIKQLYSVKDYYEVDRKFQYLPIEKEHYDFYKKIGYEEYVAQSQKYVLFSIYEEDIETNPEFYLPTYYIYLKKDLIVKKIGYLPEEEIGENYTCGWGCGHKIYGDTFYILTAKYTRNISNMRMPYKIIISLVDLKNVVSLPSVEIKRKD